MAQPATQAFSSQGTLFEVYISGTPTELYEIYGITDSGGDSPDIDVTTMGSTTEETIPDFPTAPQYDFEMNHLPSDVVHQYMEAAKNNRTKEQFRITSADAGGETVVFYGYVKKYARNWQTRNAVKVSVSIKQSGDAVVTP